jgi:hypothetical protein
VRSRLFFDCTAVAAAVFGLRLTGNDYVLFAGYVVLQYVAGDGLNILGGYTGTNFGWRRFSRSAPIARCSSTNSIRCRSRC